MYGHCHQRVGEVARQGSLSSLVVVVSRETRAVQRAWQVVAHRVYQWLNALVLEGGTHHQRHDVPRDGSFADGFADHFFRHGLLFEHQLHYFVVEHAQRVEHIMTGSLGCVGIFRGNISFNNILAAVALEGDSLHFHQVYHAEEIFARAHLQLYRHDVQA